MKILAAIASYGTKNLQYLDVLVKEYRTMPYHVDIVVLSNVAKALDKDLEVVVGLPARNPWSLPFAHRPLFARRANDYDLYIYSEDDTLIRQGNIAGFLESTAILPGTEVAGFLRYETGSDGRRYVSSAHGPYHWLGRSAKLINGHVFAQFSNQHSGCYILTQKQLLQAIESGGFLVPPHEGQYDMLCSAATDPYTRCGFTKVINLSNIEESLLPHLPNRYVGVMGTGFEEFNLQIECLKQIAAGKRIAATGISALPAPRDQAWLRRYCEPRHAEILGLVPAEARSVLSIGIGTGATECELVGRGLEVTAIPLDSIIAAAAEACGVAMVHRELVAGVDALQGNSYDCVIIRNLLYMLGDAKDLLRRVAPLVADHGTIVIMEPNYGNLQTRTKRLLGMKGYRELGSFSASGVSPITGGMLQRLLRSCGFSRCRMNFVSDKASAPRHFVFRKLPLRLTATAVIATARRQTTLVR